MKSFLVTAGLSALFVVTHCQAITLKLDPEIEMLVLDGRKVSGSLLRGADSLELERGEHQFLFRVEKNLAFSVQNPKKRLYQSEPMIVTFFAETKSIRIRLPALDNPKQRMHFNRKLDFQLVDEQGRIVTSKRDRLSLPAITDPERAMGSYNRNGGIASVPRFARIVTGPNLSVSLSDIPTGELADPPLLRQWVRQIDNAIRQRLPGWVRIFTAG